LFSQKEEQCHKWTQANIPTEYTYELIRDGVGVDSRGDIYAGLTQERSVDKLVRTR
jgi:hypothetical protein